MTNVYKYSTLKTSVAMAVLLLVPALSFARVGLSAAASYTVLAGSAITSTGLTSVRGDVGLSPGTLITGLPTGQPTLGTIHAGDAGSAQAQVALAAAYNRLIGMPCTVSMRGENLGGRTPRRGTYWFAASADLAGSLNLDARGDSSAVFVFQIRISLRVASCASIRLCNGARPSHAGWLVGNSEILGVASTMQGNLIARSSIGRANRPGGGAQTACAHSRRTRFSIPRTARLPAGRSRWPLVGVRTAGRGALTRHGCPASPALPRIARSCPPRPHPSSC